MGPDDESVIYISEPAYGFVCHLFFLLKIFHEEISDYGRKWRAHCYPVSSFIELSLKTKICRC